ncbi:thioredoxin family protein [Veillonella criceti]|nr:thioredoxin family protein [Veillonella criceti]
MKYNIQGIPTLICFKNGKEKDRIAGYKPAPIVEGLIRSIIK